MMATYVVTLDKLSIALHSAVPSVLTICIVYSCFVDKAFVLFRLTGESLPRRLKIGVRFVYTFLNIIGNALVFAFLFYKCSLWDVFPYTFGVSRLKVEDMEQCLPAFSACCILAMLLMWLDRSMYLFFQIGPPTTNILTRSCTAATVAGAFMAASQNDACGLVLLLLFYTGRRVGPLVSEQMRNFASASRFAVRLYAFCFGVALIWNKNQCEHDMTCRAMPKTACLIISSSLVLE